MRPDPPNGIYRRPSSTNVMPLSIVVKSTDAPRRVLGGLFSFADENSKQLAGLFFQASLIPYLLFLYFVGYSANRVPGVGNFGLQYLLLFVAMTIAAGICAKTTYDYSLADVDWIHGLSESLLTVSNLLVVFGFNEAMTKPEPASKRICIVAVIYAAICFAFLGFCLGIFEEHSQLLGGFGNIPEEWREMLPWVKYEEPENALSIATWMVHFSSVFEYLFAMNLIWKYSDAIGNERYKGLTWSMIPLHMSSICAVTHHFFYNAKELLFLVTLQVFLTFIGNVTTMAAAVRIARSCGWSTCICGSFPFRFIRSEVQPAEDDDQLAAEPRLMQEDGGSSAQLAFKLLILVSVSSYIVKYGELGLDLPFHPNSLAALAMVLGIPCLTVLHYTILSFSVPKQPHDEESRGQQGEMGKEGNDALECDEETSLLHSIKVSSYKQ